MNYYNKLDDRYEMKRRNKVKIIKLDDYIIGSIDWFSIARVSIEFIYDTKNDIMSSWNCENYQIVHH